MSILTVSTPLELGECGCYLETGDNSLPLFVPCPHNDRETARAYRDMVTENGELRTVNAALLEALEALLDASKGNLPWDQARAAIRAAKGE